MTEMKEKPKAKSSLAQKELDKAQEQFDAFEKSVKEITLDRTNAAPKQDLEPQTKLGSKDIEKSKEIYLKPVKTIGCRDKFNEDYREQYNYDKEYVYFIAENNEIIGEEIDLWTRPYAGMPAEEWKVPVNKPVWGPRYLAEQIKRAHYSRLKTQDQVHTNDGVGSYYGTMVVDQKIQRLDARPATTRKSIFMGANSF